MVKNTLIYRLNFFALINYIEITKDSRNKFLESILIFENEQERKLFREYAQFFLYNKTKLLCIDKFVDVKSEKFKDDINNMAILKELLNDLRGNKKTVKL